MTKEQICIGYSNTFEDFIDCMDYIEGEILEYFILGGLVVFILSISSWIVAMKLE
jgi:hypothetical protein